MRRNFMSGMVLMALAVFSVATMGGILAPQAMAGRPGGGGGGGGGHVLTFSGVIGSIDYSSRTITTSSTLYYNPSRVWNITTSSTITLNGKSVTLNDLKVGDSYTISVDDHSLSPSILKATR